MTRRKTITAAMERRIIMAQMAEGYVSYDISFGIALTCGCGCGTLLGFETPVIREHIIPLALGGADDWQNIRLWYKPCADRKTRGTKATTAGSDIANIAKTKRLRGETCTGPKRKIQNVGFPKNLRKRMDGTVERRMK